MAADKDVWVSSQIQDNDWALTFKYAISMTRHRSLADLLLLLRCHTFRGAPDHVAWKERNVITFTVRSQYLLQQLSYPQDKAT